VIITLKKTLALAAIIAVSSVNLLGCAVDKASATNSTESTGSTKLPLIAHDIDGKLVLVGIYDSEALTIRIGSEFANSVRSTSADTPSIVIGDATYPLDADDVVAISDEVNVGDTLSVSGRDDQGATMTWELEVMTPEAASEAAVQTQFPMELIDCG
jgi:hypothetical protein